MASGVSVTSSLWLTVLGRGGHLPTYSPIISGSLALCPAGPGENMKEVSSVHADTLNLSSVRGEWRDNRRFLCTLFTGDESESFECFNESI